MAQDPFGGSAAPRTGPGRAVVPVNYSSMVQRFGGEEASRGGPTGHGFGGGMGPKGKGAGIPARRARVWGRIRPNRSGLGDAWGCGDCLSDVMLETS